MGTVYQDNKHIHRGFLIIIVHCTCTNIICSFIILYFEADINEGKVSAVLILGHTFANVCRATHYGKNSFLAIFNFFLQTILPLAAEIPVLG